MWRPTLRFHLRLAILVITLTGVLLAWSRYRTVISQYDARLQNANLVPAQERLRRLDAKIEHFKKTRLDIPRDTDVPLVVLRQLAYLEAEKSLWKLEFSGCQVDWPAPKRRWPRIDLGRRALSDGQCHELLESLTATGRYYSAMEVAIKDTRFTDVEGFVNDLQTACPKSLVVR